MSNYYYQQNTQNEYSSSGNQQPWGTWPVDSSSVQSQGQSNTYAYLPFYDQTAKLAYEARVYANANNPQRYSQESANTSTSVNQDSDDTYRQSRYSNSRYSNDRQSNWQRRHQSRKRQRNDSFSTRTSSEVSRRKSRSHTDTKKVKWEKEDALRAIEIEREYHSQLKNHTLLIKFPDPNLNSDIVKEFHPAIENVHFQQASTPRYCHVTLDPDSDTNIVKNALNRQKFGEGYLSVDLKRDKDDEQDVSPDEIDPYTLYVDNISTEVSEDAIRDKYPASIKINLGFAQKMKNSRYAFVCFKTVEDSIAAFKDTHQSDIFSRNLKVRFRRLHGNVGMPGESKHQNPPKSLNFTDQSLINVNSPVIEVPPDVVETAPIENEDKLIKEEKSDEDEETDNNAIMDINFIKNEPVSEDSMDEEYWQTLSLNEPAAAADKVKSEPDQHPAKTEPDDSDESDSSASERCDNIKVKQEPDADILKEIKSEPTDLNDSSSDDEYERLLTNKY